MVGVPGRSKCCGTCRRRKKGNCDRKRPSCGQCIHHGLKCDGYGRETIFVNAMSGRAEQYRIERPRREAIVPPDADPETLARTAREELYIGSFWHRYLPEAREFQPRAVPYTNGGWTVALPKLYGASPLIRKIMLAVCLAMAGRTAARERDREEGLRYYTSSLEGMARALKDGRKVDHTTLIVTARLFSLYELLCGHDPRDQLAQADNWRKHITGELALITSQPPETYSSGYMHQFWVDGRLHLTTCFMQMRKRSPLSSPEWKTIPWQTIPKTPKDLVIDILIETPGLLEDLDVFEAQRDPDTRAALRQDLINKCWALESELAAWRTTVQITSPTYALDVLKAPFSMDLLAAAHVMSMYWAACIVIYNTLERLLPAHEAADLPPHMNPQIYFRRVAEAATFMMHPSSGIYGTQLTHFPSSLVLAYISAGGGGEDARDMIFDAYKKLGREEIVKQFQASMRRQGAKNGWGRHRGLGSDEAGS